VKFPSNSVRTFAKRVPLLPNLITAFGLSCGLFAIFRIAVAPQAEITEPFLLSITTLLLVAAFADVLDGAVARAMKVESAFGGLFDSLADAISFGVAPSVIVLKSFPTDFDSGYAFGLSLAALIFSVSGVLRLVRFNLLADEAKHNSALSAAHKTHFTGLPIPAAASAIISLNFWLHSSELHYFWKPTAFVQFWILFFALFLLGYFMISRWKFLSVKSLRVPVQSFELVFVMAVGAVLLFWGIFNFFPTVFLVVSWGYLIVAWSFALVRLIAGKRASSLEGFEPESGSFLEELHHQDHS
jgi:Phosphatidylserine synthase